MSSSNSSTFTLPKRPASLVASKELKDLPAFPHLPVQSAIMDGTPTTEGTSGVFHFRLSLLGRDPDQVHERAIRFDISPSMTDLNHPMRGILVVGYMEHASPPSAGSDPFVVRFRPGVLASEICQELLENHKLDQYEFTPEGNGCRYWCKTALERMADAGFLEEDVRGPFQEFEAEQLKKFGVKRFPVPIFKGSFYD